MSQTFSPSFRRAIPDLPAPPKSRQRRKKAGEGRPRLARDGDIDAPHPGDAPASEESKIYIQIVTINYAVGR